MPFILRVPSSSAPNGTICPRLRGSLLILPLAALEVLRTFPSEGISRGSVTALTGKQSCKGERIEGNEHQKKEMPLLPFLFHSHHQENETEREKREREREKSTPIRTASLVRLNRQRELDSGAFVFLWFRHVTGRWRDLRHIFYPFELSVQ